MARGPQQMKSLRELVSDVRNAVEHRHSVHYRSKGAVEPAGVTAARRRIAAYEQDARNRQDRILESISRQARATILAIELGTDAEAKAAIEAFERFKVV